MTTGPRLTPGRPAIAADRAAAHRMRRALAEELPKVREAALAWRNGLAGLFVGLLGFGLVKGRTDVTKLASPYDALVGGMLLLSLVCGAVGALYLLRAAHGTPVATPLVLESGAGVAARYAGDHVEAGRALRAMRRGVVLTMACGALLVAGVAFTWYGPVKDKPQLLVKTPSGTECGEPLRVERGVVVLKTDTGEMRVSLVEATAVMAVEVCPGTAPGG
ncbi:hypothetical protein GCM10010294_27870 [Streptomyces griseoloalbus]|uniref:hypothetical protein n=1 Tax=Streptomyces griseoloalbus TaxID=67303 RepID=UPI001876FB41|nr:hypothetical protein GCM10010294_27870 [Streptomyces griseoloalbus]